MSQAETLAERIVDGGRRFHAAVLSGLAEAGVDTTDAVELMLAIRRIGGKRLEELFGSGRPDAERPRGRLPVVPSPVLEEIEQLAAERTARIDPAGGQALKEAGLGVVVATTDVHEHGKLVIEQVLSSVGVAAIDGGVSTDPDVLVETARATGADAIAISTYNGIALDYVRRLFAELNARNLDLPVLIGGRLNQVPQGSNTSLPVDVSGELAEAGAIVCAHVEDAIPALARIAEARTAKKNKR